MTDSKYVEICTRNIGKTVKNLVGDNKILIFDIDQCLYNSPELNDYEHEIIKEAFIEISKLTDVEWHENLSKYNLFREIFFTLYGIHPKEFCERYEEHHPPKFIEKDPELRNILLAVKCRKICFTNGPKTRAMKILQHMDLEDIFEVIICNDIEDTEFICKPQPVSFEFVDKYMGITNKEKVYFFDDSEKNIEAAKSYGWNGILVNGNIKDLVKAHVE